MLLRRVSPFRCHRPSQPCHSLLFYCAPRSELSEERAAALLDEGRRTRYLDCRAGGAAAPSAGSQGGEQGPAVAADVLRQWPHAALQAVEGTCLPQVRVVLRLRLAGCSWNAMMAPLHCHKEASAPRRITLPWRPHMLRAGCESCVPVDP